MKFAYMIMAHDNINQLLKLLRLLDFYGNDIFLHIDKKMEIDNHELLYSAVSRAQFNLYSEFDVKWGGFSQTECQMFLLDKAVKTFHDYYHLLSGHDLPLKTNYEIADFFTKNKGKEFIHFESDGYCLKSNCRYYHFDNFSEKERLLSLQKKLNVNRRMYCGANWYSITHNLAVEFSKKKRLMLRRVRWSRNSDEYILQTFYRQVAKGNYVLYKATNGADDYSGTAREIDWMRGKPYVWKKEDFEYLIHSDRMFARKFDERVDNDIIEMLVKYIDERKIEEN